jgi:hypothetical protein
MSSLLRAALATLALSFTACGPAPDMDESVLEGLEVANEEADAKADGASSYAWVRPSIGVIRCLRAPCASHLARGVNGVEGRPVYVFDLRALGLSASRRAEVSASLSDLLVRGRYARVQVSGTPMAVFQVTRALEPASGAADSPSEDRYYNVSAADVRCVAEPCPTLRARPVTGGSEELWNRADATRLGPQVQGTATLDAELKKGQMVVSVSAVRDRVAQLTQAFRPVK